MGTRARDFSRGAGGTGGNITIGDVLPYLTTSNVTELGNLYFTNARVVANLQTLSINVLADVNTSGATPSAQVGYVLTWNGNIWTPNTVIASLQGLTTDDLPEGISNLYYTNTRVRSAIGAANPTIIYDPFTGLFSANVEAIAFAANTTDGVPEGFTNKYYTNARVLSYVNTLSLDDLDDVNYAYGAPDQNGKALVWDANNSVWIAGQPNVGYAFYAETAGEANTVSTLGNFTTDDLAEGTSNFYFSNARVEQALANISIGALSDVNIVQANLIQGRLLGWTGTAWEALDGANISGVATSSFAESSNFSNVSNFANIAQTANITNFAALAQTANVVNFANIAETANVVNFANIAETANLVNFANLSGVANASYFSDLADTANVSNFANTAGLANVVLTLSNFDTDDLSEGSNNLYYTDARVLANISQLSVDVFADVDTSNANVGAILVYDGAVWLANNIVGQALQAATAATADEANVANTVRTLDNFTTSNLAEGTNLYFTTDRANAVILPWLVDKNVTLNDLTVSGNLLVQGDSAIFNVAEFETEAKNLILGKNAGSTEGIGIEFSDAGNIRYSIADGGKFTFDNNLEITGNLIPSASGIFNLGSINRKWRSVFVGATTIYLGNLIMGESDAGGLSVIDFRTGDPAPIQLSNAAATQLITVNRLSNTLTDTEFSVSYIGGNTNQYINGTNGNLYLGIMPELDPTRFGGIHLVQKQYDGSNSDIDVVIETSRLGDSNSVARISVNADSNIVVDGNVVVNGNTLTQIARYSISAQSNVIETYSNTTPAVEYNNISGVMTVSKDGVYETTAILTITPEWQNTPVEAAYMPTGTYVVQIFANDSSVGGGHTSEYYSGIMSWFAEETNSLVFDEVSLHRAGAGPGSGALFLRIQRTSTSGVDTLILQIAGVTTNSSTSSYTFKFRRLL